VTDATGVAGSEPTASLVAEVTPTFWPTVGVIAGIILILAGVLVLATGMRWPASSRRYRGARLEQAGAGEATSPASDRAIDDWDELSRGDDPTDDIDASDDTSPTEPNR
jgi:uncharacterized membrane protein (TIGR02234 family)